MQPQGIKINVFEGDDETVCVGTKWQSGKVTFRGVRTMV
jgi:hypothetical protein